MGTATAEIDIYSYSEGKDVRTIEQPFKILSLGSDESDQETEPTGAVSTVTVSPTVMVSPTVTVLPTVSVPPTGTAVLTPTAVPSVTATGKPGATATQAPKATVTAKAKAKKTEPFLPGQPLRRDRKRPLCPAAPIKREDPWRPGTITLSFCGALLRSQLLL